MIKRVIETVQFELAENVQELEFIAEIEKSKPILASLDGFVKRCVGKNANGVWLDMCEWESEDEFQSLLQILQNTNELTDYADMVNLQTANSQSYELEARFFSI